MNTITTIATTNDINQLARKAAAGTLKRIYTASGQDMIRKLQQSLQADFNRLDNAEYNTTINVIGQTISDAYDIFLVAYEYLHEQIIVNGLSSDDTITVTLKNGNDKTRTVFQWACVAVRKYIYSNKSIENNGKYIYIEDMKQDTNDTANNALDREYIRMGKYNGIQTYNDYTQYDDIMKLFEDKPQLLKVIRMRMQGMSVTAIAEKLDVSHPAISKQLIKAQTIINDNFPELTRGFKEGRNLKNTTSDSNTKFWNSLMRNNF